MSCSTHPAHWIVKQLKYVCVLQRGFDLPSQDREQGRFPVYSGAGITGYHDHAIVEPPGIVTGRYGTIGEVHLVLEPFWPLNTALYVKELWGNSPEFVRYLLSSLPLKTYSAKAAVPGVDRNDLHVIPVAVPPIEEQKNISQFLDRKTAAIDTLIAKKQRLIALLEEKRSALINQAVTKGLDRAVRMKDSGIPWIGEIPEHWVLLPVKRVASVFVPQRNKPQLNENEGYPWITCDEIGSRFVETSNKGLCVTQEAMQEAGTKLLRSGSVIAGCVGTFGTASISKSPIVINQQLQAYEPHNITADFLRFCILNSKDYYLSVATATTIVYVNSEGFANLSIPLPPHDEELAISDYLYKNCQHIDQLQNRIKLQIEKLQEYRQSLITAAVTGKLPIPDESRE